MVPGGVPREFGSPSRRPPSFRCPRRPWSTARDAARTARARVRQGAPPSDVGPLSLTFQTFDVRGASGQQLVVYQAEPGSRGAQALALLGSAAARLEPAERGAAAARRAGGDGGRPGSQNRNEAGARTRQHGERGRAEVDRRRAPGRTKLAGRGTTEGRGGNRVVAAPAPALGPCVVRCGSGRRSGRRPGGGSPRCRGACPCRTPERP
ncbi:hypothetical protein [Streptomyces sp. NPDC058623]|uniref:MmyB family transcriptional regulator n=1 Tax=Streptomyces sp. NPDC058623 TaxID=3346563 RepID=UPI0036645F1E